VNLKKMAECARDCEKARPGYPMGECDTCGVVRPIRTGRTCFGCTCRAGAKPGKKPPRPWTMDETARLMGVWERTRTLDGYSRVSHVVVLCGVTWREACRRLVELRLLAPSWLR
jgi:hypothetical protein